MSAIDDLARRLARLEKQQLASSTPQLAYSSIENGALRAHDDALGETMQIGLQWDGTYAPTVSNGPTPPAPSDPVVADATEALVVAWDGTFAAGAVAPMDFLRVDVHIGPDSSFVPSHTNRYATFSSPSGGTTGVHLPYGTYWVKLVCWTLAGKVSVASGAVEGDSWPVQVSSDGFPPASSPTPEVIGGLDLLHVRWTPVVNVDPVTYDVHVSATSGFTPDSTTLAGSTESSMFSIKALPGAAPPEGEDDPRKLLYDTDYYVKVVARDADGSAAASAEDAARVFQVTGVNLAVDSVTAANIAFGSIVGDHLSSSVILAGEIKTAETGQRVGISTSGIQGFKSDNSLMLNFPTDPAGTALIDAEVVARALTVTGGSTFRSTSHIERDASFVLKTATGAPTATPQLANTRTTRLPSTGSLTEAQRTGLLGTFGLIPSEVSCIEWKEATDTWVIHQIRPNGTRAWFFDYDGNPDNFTYGTYFADYENWEIWSVIEITTSTPAKNGVYRMARWIPAGSSNTYYLMCPQGGGFNRYSRLNSAAPPVVGSNGTDVYVAEVASNQLNIRYFAPNGDGNNVSAPFTVYQSASGFTNNRPLSTVLYDAGAFDTGGAAARYLVGERGFGTANKLVYTSGTNANSIFPGGASSWVDVNKDAESFEAATTNPRCIAWMESDNSFWTYGGDGYLHQHTEEFWNPATTSSTVWVQESYYNTTSLYETAPGPFKSIVQERRANITVYFPPVPGTGTSVEPNAWRIYAARKATQPTNSEMWLQSTPGSNNGSTGITPLQTTGSHPLASGTFPNSNPGKITDDLGNMVISGDGTIKIGGKDVALGTPTVQNFTSSGTWSKPSGAKLVRVQVKGGGGAGGGAVAAAAGQHSSGAGGGAGGYAEKWYLASDLASSIPVSVGGGGVGVAGAVGGSGGASNFQHTTNLIGNGGNGGAAKTLSSASSYGQQPGAGGTASGGDILIPGGGGAVGWGDGTFGSGGNGGSGMLGFGGAGRAHSAAPSSLAGFAGGNYGGGGGGALSAGGGAAAAGGNGAPGIVIVTCYY